MSMNTILYERQLEQYYCTLCYAFFDFKRRDAHAGQLGPAVSDSRCTADGSLTQIELPGVPLGSFPGIDYDEVTLRPAAGDVFVFCTDGVFEAFNAADEEFGVERGCGRSWSDAARARRDDRRRDR